MTGASKPISVSTDIRVGPGVPFFVKIWMTPFAASDPYSVVAAPPGTYSMRSMFSSGMSAMEEVCVPWRRFPDTLSESSAIVFRLSTRTPST